MKKFCRIAILLFGLSPVFAQEFFLPVSTTSAVAKQAYYMAVKDYKKSAKNFDKAAELGMESSKELADTARSMME